MSRLPTPAQRLQLQTWSTTVHTFKGDGAHNDELRLGGSSITCKLCFLFQQVRYNTQKALQPGLLLAPEMNKILSSIISFVIYLLCLLDLYLAWVSICVKLFIHNCLLSWSLNLSLLEESHLSTLQMLLPHLFLPG